MIEATLGAARRHRGVESVEAASAARSAILWAGLDGIKRLQRQFHMVDMRHQTDFASFG